jgi:Tol biopolymer transport system component
MNVDGTQPTNITRSGGYNETTPAWATDNRRIVYQSADAGISHPAVRWMVAGFDGSQAKEIQEWEPTVCCTGRAKW